MSAGTGRNSFTIKDDREMLKFLINEIQVNKNPDAMNPKGLAIWKLAENRKITSKSYHSMSTRMRRHILPTIDLQPITKEQKDFLKKTFSLETSKESKSDTNIDEVLENSYQSSTDASDDEDESLSDTETKLGARPKRINYTDDDDIKMLEFLRKEIQRHNLDTDQPFGLRLWQVAYLEDVTKHSAQSMNTRFSRILFPKLNELNYVPEDLKKFLNQRLVQKNVFPIRSTRSSPTKATTNVSHKKSPFKKQPQNDEKTPENDEIPRKRILRSVTPASKPKISESEIAGPSTRSKNDDEESSTDEEGDDAITDDQPNEDDLMKIFKNGGQLSNDARFKSVLFDHIYRGTFETRDEVKIFTEKFRLIEAMSRAYAIPVPEILPLIKNCNNDLIEVEHFLYEKHLEKFKS